MTKKQNHRWNTKEYENRTKELYRTDLYKLYPSESWALYRVLPKCMSVLDLGCGNGAMASISYKISNLCKYHGVDHQHNLIENAKKKFKYATFESSDLNEFLKKKKKKYDCVMSWSVIKSFKNWRQLINLMIEKAKKYVICDIRVANVDDEFFDENICWAEYQGKKGPIVVVNYNTFRKAITRLKNKLSRVEFIAYQSEWGKFVNFKEKFKPDTFLLTCVIHKKKSNKEFEIFERLPDNLKR